MPLYQYRLLSPDEWDKLAPIEAMGPIPTPDSSFCIVIETQEDEPEVVGALFLQQQLHAEPFVVVPEHRTAGISAHAAFGAMEVVLQEQFQLPLMYHVLVADDPAVLETARGWGLQPLAGYIPHVKVLE